MAHIFISYSHQDQDYAHRLAGALEWHGFEVWIDSRINCGTAWPEEIKNRAEACAALVVIVSKDAMKSGWVEKEVEFAKNNEKPIFPLSIDGTVCSWIEEIQHEKIVGKQLPSKELFAVLSQFAPSKKHLHINNFYASRAEFGGIPTIYNDPQRDLLVVGITLEAICRGQFEENSALDDCLKKGVIVRLLFLSPYRLNPYSEKIPNPLIKIAERQTCDLGVARKIKEFLNGLRTRRKEQVETGVWQNGGLEIGIYDNMPVTACVLIDTMLPDKKPGTIKVEPNLKSTPMMRVEPIFSYLPAHERPSFEVTPTSSGTLFTTLAQSYARLWNSAHKLDD